MPKKFKPFQPEQVRFITVSLPDDHVVKFVLDMVNRVDLSAIYARYGDGAGAPPFSPHMMVAVWILGYLSGIRSSRKLERACIESIAFRYLVGSEAPDFWALNEFRKRHASELAGLFEQTVTIAKQCGLASLGNIAIDGTKIKANASKHSAMSYGRLLQKRSELQKDIEEYLKATSANDTDEDEMFGKGKRDSNPEWLADQKSRLERIEMAIDVLEERAKKKNAVESPSQDDETDDESPPPPAPPTQAEVSPRDKDQINFTDPDSRIMLGADKAFVQAYNAQAAVDVDSQIIVACDLTNCAADSQHLIPLLKAAATNVAEPLQRAVADAGYFSEANVRAARELGCEPLIPPNRIKHSDWKNVQPPKGRPPKNLSIADQMRRELATKEGRAIYKMRQQSVEPVFGQIKEGRGLRQVTVRGLQFVKSMWQFECAVHNIAKLWRAQPRFELAN